MRAFDRLIGCITIAALSAASAMSVFAPTAGAQTSGYVTMSDSAKLYYRVIGQGSDTLIAIHGGPGMDLESIYGDFTPLGARHVVIFYDQRGGGKSELPADTMRLVAARQIRDLDELRRHFRLAKVTLIAHSYGPLLAASYALAHPDAVKRMVFFGPVPPYRGDFNARDKNHPDGHGGGVGDVDATCNAAQNSERRAFHVRRTPGAGLAGRGEVSRGEVRCASVTPKSAWRVISASIRRCAARSTRRVWLAR